MSVPCVYKQSIDGTSNIESWCGKKGRFNFCEERAIDRLTNRGQDLDKVCYNCLQAILKNDELEEEINELIT